MLHWCKFLGRLVNITKVFGIQLNTYLPLGGCTNGEGSFWLANHQKCAGAVWSKHFGTSLFHLQLLVLGSGRSISSPNIVGPTLNVFYILWICRWCGQSQQSKPLYRWRILESLSFTSGSDFEYYLSTTTRAENGRLSIKAAAFIYGALGHVWGRPRPAVHSCHFVDLSLETPVCPCNEMNGLESHHVYLLLFLVRR